MSAIENLRQFKATKAGNSPEVPRSTVFISRLAGLYIVLVSSSMLLHKERSLEIVNRMMRDPALLFTLGTFGATAGLAIVIAHNVWRGRPLSIVVTLAGWMSLLKGVSLMLMATTTGASEVFPAALRYNKYFYGYMIAALIIGLGLAYFGFTAHANESRRETGI